MAENSAPAAPAILEPVFDTVPATLVTQPIWVLWKLLHRGGKWTKVPFQTSGKAAKSNDPATWTTFQRVKATYQKQPDAWSGIGLMLEGSDLVGIDLDDKGGRGLFLSADGTPTDDLQVLLGFLDTYAEVSPGGKGVRILARGTIPGSGRNANVEIYATGSPRFLTITGRRVPGAPASINERTETLTYFHEMTLGQPPQQAQKDGPQSTQKRVSPLRGDRGHVPGDVGPLTDHSAADLARCATGCSPSRRETWPRPTGCFGSLPSCGPSGTSDTAPTGAPTAR
jgi:putative DNA primase/helicase